MERSGMVGYRLCSIGESPFRGRLNRPLKTRQKEMLPSLSAESFGLIRG
jgi:hypothetical protein